ncbi:hypothetical protein [Streptomyces spongiae]|uniref:Uncharacterized protein n=1 Tax=Streptomyces spongiae TaxID=565072 RepID=A0A5N8XN41_9ACTN|nr:hypothetical protein [Streptomyces spongiae]MPY60536.1 hypothetical protein [Streptomyces spongiae]
MFNLILRALDALTALFAPRGRHRAGHASPAPVHHREPRPGVHRAPGPYVTDTFLDGAATPPVRPYVLTTEQRARRRALWLATYGIDVGPRRIHGVEVG